MTKASYKLIDNVLHFFDGKEWTRVSEIESELLLPVLRGFMLDAQGVWNINLAEKPAYKPEPVTKAVEVYRARVSAMALAKQAEAELSFNHEESLRSTINDLVAQLRVLLMEANCEDIDVSEGKYYQHSRTVLVTAKFTRRSVEGEPMDDDKTYAVFDVDQIRGYHSQYGVDHPDTVESFMVDLATNLANNSAYSVECDLD